MNGLFSDITGVEISYYMICKRKLWLFSHNIQMEHNSENVSIGSVLHELSYERKRKEIQIGPVKIDFFEKNKALIHEVKKSKAVEDSHTWQLKYYLHLLHGLGIAVQGKIDYPLIKKTSEVIYKEEDRQHIEAMLNGINEVRQVDKIPSLLESPICKKCSYYELCYV